MSTRKRFLWGLAVGLLVLIVAGTLWLRARAQADRLLATEPSAALADPQLMAYARRRAASVYAEHCSSCHGADRHGDLKRGIPNLVDASWIYASDPVSLEHTITYGIRSGHPKARNIAEMPGFALTKQLTRADVADVTEYLLAISGQPRDEEAAARGRKIYYDKGNCYDCHASDARGVIDYGAPPLTGPGWLYGGDRATLYRTIFGGRHGKCPAWTNVISVADIRALALDLTPDKGRADGK